MQAAELFAQTVKASIVLVWDRLNTHVSRKMRTLVAERGWLTVFLLPACSPHPYPVEGAWAHVRRSLADLAAALDRLETLVRNRLERLRRNAPDPAAATDGHGAAELPGAPSRHSFDRIRHDALGMFAALSTAARKKRDKLPVQHRPVGFRGFLNENDRQARPGLAVRVNCESLSTHKASWCVAGRPSTPRSSVASHRPTRPLALA
ncbi:transposase [Streptomyces kebangsaanensis]|uniref:Transposase n=1 Tax=Streptomyces kebangsaanensis TaxID=864058 RepID=A0ABW6KVE1_9ACTN